MAEVRNEVGNEVRKEYIDREAAIKYLENHKKIGIENNIILAADEDVIIKFLRKKCPTADVVEVVRCKECKRCELRYPAKAIGEEAIEGYWCHSNQKYVTPSDFCSYGERKGGKLYED